MSEQQSIGADLEKLQLDTFSYFLAETSTGNGLVADNTRGDAVASIAATGMGLAAFAVGAERGFITRSDAIGRTLVTLRFLRGSPQGPDPDATGYRGFYYHFLDLETGRRTWNCELSVVDTAFLIAGALTSMMYFDREEGDEKEIRDLVRFLYERIEWNWAMNDGPAISMGWKPGLGFLTYGWDGYTEAILLYVLGLGSPTHPLPASSYAAWTLTYQWENLYGYDHLFAAPLFVHQLSHVWIDFRGIQDAFMREKRSDYFVNSRRATSVQREYAARNPRRLKGYSESCWGFTACAGPGPATRRVDGAVRKFLGYAARSVPYGPDDGTIAPWAAIASLPFAPEVVSPALQHLKKTYPSVVNERGWLSSFNPTFGAGGEGRHLWVCPDQYGIELGPIVLMIENHRSGLLWRLLRGCPPIVTGLRRAGFRNGWLGSGGS